MITASIRQPHWVLSQDNDTTVTNLDVEQQNTGKLNEMDKICQRIMLIDDDDVSLFIARSLLSRLPDLKRIETFTQASEALKALKNRCCDTNLMPDLILLDLDMPVMGGWEFLKNFAVLAQWFQKKPEVWIVSSTIDPEEIKQADENSMVTKFISKPIRPEHIESLKNWSTAKAKEPGATNKQHLKTKQS
ncbi:MAG: response regulator [Salibacteraceae bacterium]